MFRRAAISSWTLFWEVVRRSSPQRERAVPATASRSIHCTSTSLFGAGKSLLVCTPPMRLQVAASVTWKRRLSMQPNDEETQKENSDVSTGSEPKSIPPRERVGFCQPPTSTRFKKGVSGNPQGRPKGSLNVASVFTKALREKVVINEHGKRKIVTKLEAALKQLVNKAASGDRHSCQQLLDLAREAEARQNAAASASETSALSEIDQEVLQGILKRFERNSPCLEASDDPHQSA